MKKQIISTFLVFCMLLTLMPDMTFATHEASSTEALFTADFLATASEHQFAGYSLDNIRQFVNDGGQIYQNFRVQYETVGTVTYRVPVQENEIEYLMSIHDSNIQPFNANPFHVERIRYSGRSHADSIVIILMGDGFTLMQYGTWPKTVVERTQIM